MFYWQESPPEPASVLDKEPRHVVFVVDSLPEPPKMEGVLEVNDLLTTGERLFEDEIMAPESIVFHKGTEMFASSLAV